MSTKHPSSSRLKAAPSTSRAAKPLASPCLRGDAVRSLSGVVLRPLLAADEPRLRAFFHRLSPQSRHQRFMAPTGELSDRMWRYLSRVDAKNHVALAAIWDGNVIGVARFVRSHDEPTLAEVAVTIADEWQRQGLGTRMLAALAVQAAQVGVRSFSATTLPDNAGIRRLLQTVGPVTTTWRDGETVLLVRGVGVPRRMERERLV